MLLAACSGGSRTSSPANSKASSSSSSSSPSATATAPGERSSSSSQATSTGGPPATDHSGDPVLDRSGNVDADVVVQAFDTLTFDKPSYDGKADLTIGLFNQSASHHTLLIEGKKGFKLEVFKARDGVVADIRLGHGTYTIYCELPGHRAAGMEAKLVIP
jgi:plastocyanin